MDEARRALDLSHRALGQRERTVAELRTYLERKRVEPGAIEQAVAELLDCGLLDDARFAQRFADDKRALERWGSERVARELRRRGVPPELIEATVAVRTRSDELASAVELLAVRVPEPPGDDRARQRAWQLLVRRGYEPELAYEAVRAHERAPASG